MDLMYLKDGPTGPNGRPDTKTNTENLNIWIANPYTVYGGFIFLVVITGISLAPCLVAAWSPGGLLETILSHANKPIHAKLRQSLSKSLFLKKNRNDLFMKSLLLLFIYLL